MKQSSMIYLGPAAHPKSKPHSAVRDTTVSMCTQLHDLNSKQDHGATSIQSVDGQLHKQR